MNAQVQWKLLKNSATWIGLLIGVTLLSIVWLGYATLRNTGLFQSSEQELSRKSGEVRLIEANLSAYRDAENGLRGFFLTADDGLLHEFYGAFDRAERLAMQLEKSYRPQVEDEAVYRQFRQAIKVRLQFLKQTADTRAVNHQLPDEATANFLREANVAKSQIRSLAAELISKLDDDLMRLEAASQDRIQWTKLEILSGHALASGLLAIAGLTIYWDRRKRALIERDLVATSQRLSGIISSASSGIISIDPKQRIVLMNAIAEKMLASTLEHAQGRSITEFFPQQDRGRYRELLEAFANSDEQQLRLSDEIRGLRESGEEFPAAMSISKSGDGEQRLITLLIRDLSEQYASQAKMREQAAILNQIRDAVQIRDIEDHITYWNHGTELLYGWTSEEVVGRHPSELMAPHRLPEHSAATESLMLYGSWIGEIIQLTKDGREILVEQRRTLLHDATGAASGQLIICLDVSERQKLELNERRRQRLESLGTLAGGIAHDLNNVLTPITMASTMLETDQPAANRERLAKTIRASAERGAEMIRQLLAFAGGGKQIERRTVSLRDVVEEVRSLLLHTLPKSIRLSIDLNDDLESIRGDATELTQVLINLAVNARDAMPSGGELFIAAQNRVITKPTTLGATLLSPGNFVELCVRDSGEGISSENAEHVFDPFFTTKEQGKGTGLGLATCLGIVHSHGGSLSLSSAVGRGSTFTILLPAAGNQAADQVHGRAPSIEKPCGHGELILVVDDENLITAMARDTLETYGYRVITAANGAEAIDLCISNSSSVAAILMDMMMPVMDGRVAIRTLRAAGISVPVIACSGLRSSTQTSADGASAFLAKPYSDKQLLQAIHEVLSNEGHEVLNT